MVSMAHILPNAVGFSKKRVPHLVKARCYADPMRPADTKPILWQNVASLMRHHWGGENLSRLSREAKVGPGTVSRIKEQRTSVGLDVLEQVAGVFELQAWHLLTPNLDPSNPPVIYLCARESELYERFLQSARDLAALNGR